MYSYDPKSGFWYGDGPDAIKPGGVTAAEIITATGIVAPEFKALMGGGLRPLSKIDNNNNTEKEEIKVPYPKKSITSNNFDIGSDSSTKILDDLEETYKDYPGFKFKNSSGMLLITAPDGKTEKYISMHQGYGIIGDNKKSQDEIQKFITDNQVKK